MRMRLAFVAILWSAAAFAVQPDEVLKDSVLETRARALSAELRCLVCQNQSIDDSDAPLARDLRILVRERLTAGDTDAQVKQFLVQRYGEFVLLRPAFNARTLVLWLTPALILIAGGVLVLAASRRRKTAAIAPAPLSDDEKKRLAQLTGD